nr:tetratricopeptide repeat protein [Gemmatimonadales bacterium]
APGPPAGVDPRRSMLVLPFDNLRDDRSVEWLRDGSVSMLGLNLSQWNDLSVVDHERLHDLLASRGLMPGSDIGLDLARRLAREAGVWTVVLGDYARAGDSLHLVARVYDVASGRRVDVARADGPAKEDVRRLFDDLAARLLDLSGAPNEIRIGLARATTQSLEAFRSYLGGVEALNRWDLGAAERDFDRAIALDSTFGLAYYKLALTRGWLVGATDSLADRAIARATTNSANLPAHERTVIGAYRAFLARDFTEARALYQQLLARDAGDADAWYGLGEAWFHDTAGLSSARGWSRALRAFRRTLRLDPTYALAYDHVHSMLSLAAIPAPMLALVSADSFTITRTPAGRMLLDSAALATATRRARGELLATARTWVTTQPAAVRAHGAMVDAYLVAGQYDAALAEIRRFREMTPTHPELPFVEARVRFAAGEVDRAATQLRRALDTATVTSFRAYDGAPSVVTDIAAAANVFAYQGDLAGAAQAIDFADRVRREIIRTPTSLADGPMSDAWKRMALGELYASVGGPVAALRQVWQGAAEAARSAPANERPHLAHTGATAAIGLFTGPAADSTALTELHALSGEPLPREVRALLALGRHDSAAARRLLTTEAAPSAWSNGAKPMYVVYSRPLTAQAYYLLGDYQATLRILRDFEPAGLQTRGFDSRWGILGRVRLLRGAAYERLGRRAEARTEYRRVLAQWRSVDPALGEYVRQAEQGLARVGESA